MSERSVLVVYYPIWLCVSGQASKLASHVLWSRANLLTSLDKPRRIEFPLFDIPPRPVCQTLLKVTGYWCRVHHTVSLFDSSPRLHPLFPSLLSSPDPTFNPLFPTLSPPSSVLLTVLCIRVSVCVRVCACIVLCVSVVVSQGFVIVPQA